MPRPLYRSLATLQMPSLYTFCPLKEELYNRIYTVVSALANNKPKRRSVVFSRPGEAHPAAQEPWSAGKHTTLHSVSQHTLVLGENCTPLSP